MSTKFQAYGLNETYPFLGEYMFKIVLNPRSFKSCHDLDVQVFDSSRTLMVYDVKKWGRKINVTFKIEKKTAEGVAYAVVSKNGKELGRLSWWIIQSD